MRFTEMKPSSLATQINRARDEYESWSDSRKAALRLEGTDRFLKGEDMHKQLLPTWEACASLKEFGQAMTPLEHYIYMYDPRNERSLRWREDLMRAIEFAKGIDCKKVA